MFWDSPRIGHQLVGGNTGTDTGVAMPMAGNKLSSPKRHFCYRGQVLPSNILFLPDFGLLNFFGVLRKAILPRWHFFSRNRGKWIRAKPLAPTWTSSSPSFLSCPPTRSNIPPKRTLAEDNKLFRTKLLIKKVGRECLEPPAKDQNSFRASPTWVVSVSLKTNARLGY